MTSVDRREFLGAIAAGAASLALPKLGTPSNRLIVGHTGITWGYAPQNAEAAIRDVGGLGYRAFESFGSVMDWWETRGGLKAQLDRAGIPLRSAYCPFELTESSRRADNIANATRWGKLIRACGGSIAVVGPNTVSRPGFEMFKSRAQIIASLNEIGRALADTGVIGVLHPHTGSCVQTRDEVYAVMNAVDTRVIMLGPDVGELTAGGADPLPIIRDFLSVIRHAHLKDYDAGLTNDGYCALGKGRVNLAAVVAELERSSADVALMVELNPSVPPSAASALSAASESKSFLKTLGYSFAR